MALDGQASELVLTVSANIAVAQRELNNLAKLVQQNAASMNTSLGTVETAHARLGQAFNNSRIAQTELTAAVTRSVDAYGAGFSPLRILTSEMGRLAEAATFLGGSGEGVMGKLAKFMSGPWGVAVLVAVAVLAKLVTSHKQAGDSVDALVDKMRQHAKQAEASKAADLAWAQTIDGLIERNEKLVESLQKRLKTEEDINLQELQGAKADLARANQDLAADKARQANLQRQLQAATANAGNNGLGTNVGGPQEARLTALKAQLDSVAEDIVKDQRGIAEAQAAIVQGTISVGEEEGKAASSLTDAVDVWSKRYLSALHGIEDANNHALAGSTGPLTQAFETLKKAMSDAASQGLGTEFAHARTAAKDLGNELAKTGNVAAYVQGIDALAKSLEAAAKAAENAKKGTGELGKQIGFSEAEAIAKGAGLTVTSGYRSEADQARLFNDPRYNHPGNAVARPGTSAHEGLNGKWALDIAFAPGLTAQSLKKLYGDQGVSLTAVYKESGHFHIEGSTSQATAAQKAADRAQQKQNVDDDAFAKESAQLDAETLAARKQLVAGYDSQAGAAADEVEAQRKAAQAAIQKQLDAHQITADQAAELSLQADDLAAAKQAVIARQKLTRGLEQQQEALDQQYDFELADLKFADDMATTAAEKRKIGLQILDIQYQQKAADLEYQKMQLERNQDFAKSLDLQARAAAIQAQIDRLPTDKAQDQERLRQGTLDPLQAWAKQVPQTAAQINEALQSIEVQGIDDLASGIADLIKGTKTFGQVFSDISTEIVGDIIQMTIKMLIFRTLSSVFPSLFGGGFGTPDFSAPVPINLNAGSVFVPARAAGGPVASGQTYLVGENGPELFVPGMSGTIVPKVPRISIPRAANSNAPQQIEVSVTASDDFNVRVVRLASGTVAQAAPLIVRAAQKGTVRSITRPRLAG